jgi:hypothetical protein
MENEELIKSLIIGTIFIAGIFAVIYSLFFFRTNFINNYFCQQSASIRSMLSNYLGDFFASIISDIFQSNFFNAVPLVCSVNNIVIDASAENADTVIANEIISCWEKFGEGKMDGIYPNSNFLCSIITYESEDKNDYVDLMNVYSIVYNRSNMGDYETFSLGNDYSLDEINPFRFCLEDAYNIFLMQELLNNGIYLGEIKDNKLAGYNINYSLKKGAEQQSLPLTYSYLEECSNDSAAEILGLIAKSSCLSLKEGAINLFRLNASMHNYNDSTSCFFTALDSITQGKLPIRLSDSEIESAVMPMELSGEFNQSLKIYNGTFYVKFFDFAYWLRARFGSDTFYFAEMNDMLYSSASLLTPYQHDYVALGYSPEIKIKEAEE